jgi:signal peptidase II
MPDHVDPASSVEEAAGNAGGAGNTDNVVSLPTDNPFSAMERS